MELGTLPGGITLFIEDGCVRLESELKESCPYCNKTDCCFDCDQSQWDDSLEDEDGTNNRVRWNAAIDGLESLILALASDPDLEFILSNRFNNAVQTALDAIGNEYGY
jgi:hypothetical protein